MTDSYYTPDRLRVMLATAGELPIVVKSIPQGKGKKKLRIEYYNVPCQFDTETTSFFRQDGHKAATMYAWMLGINDQVMLGRTWEEYDAVMEKLRIVLGLCQTRRLVLYVHNLGFDYQWICRRHNWTQVEALKQREPFLALTDTGFEFRCSFSISHMNLAGVGQECGLEKAVGDLDYRVIRHSGTPLSPQEIHYCVRDVQVVMAYIRKKISQDGDITKISRTQTGYVRKYCRKHCMQEGAATGYKGLDYKRLMKMMPMTEEEYCYLREAFAGGYTHGAAHILDRTLENVTSFDFTSSYPAVMVSEMFPMSAGKYVDHPDNFDELVHDYLCVFDIECRDIRTKPGVPDYYLSSHKCLGLEGQTVVNGRVAYANHLLTTITNVDWEVIKQCYDIGEYRIGRLYYYTPGLMPTAFIEVILDLYQQKTTLKGVQGEEERYGIQKQMLNSLYGMSVTKISRDQALWDDDVGWHGEEADVAGSVDEYNNDPSRFVCYAWGVFVTQYQRRNAWSGILACGDDYCYCDTDSLKILHADRHQDYFEQYNTAITEKLRNTCRVLGLDESLIAPKTVKGVSKPLGVWDWDGEYSLFKTEGAKRYLVKYSDNPKNKENRGHISMTVAGLNPDKACDYIVEKYGESGAFSAFRDGMTIPHSASGKMTHTYLDDPFECVLTDCNGLQRTVRERTGIHLIESSYEMSLVQELLDYIDILRQQKQENRTTEAMEP